MTELLSKEQLADLLKQHQEGGLCSSEIDDLFDHVRTLEADLREGEMCELCEKFTNEPDGNPRTFIICGACWNERERKYNAQLREVKAERDSFHKIALLVAHPKFENLEGQTRYVLSEQDVKKARKVIGE